MCFGSSPKPPAAQPLPAPTPVPTPSEVSPQAAGDARRKQLENMRYGLASTIKTTPRGLVGAGADLTGQSNLKTKLG